MARPVGNAAPAGSQLGLRIWPVRRTDQFHAPMHSMPEPGVADIGQPTSTPGLGWSATARTPVPHQTLRMSGGASRRWRRAARAWHVAYACRSQRAISRLRRTTREVPPSRAGWTPVVVVVAPHNELSWHQTQDRNVAEPRSTCLRRRCRAAVDERLTHGSSGRRRRVVARRSRDGLALVMRVLRGAGAEATEEQEETDKTQPQHAYVRAPAQGKKRRATRRSEVRAADKLKPTRGALILNAGSRQLI